MNKVSLKAFKKKFVIAIMTVILLFQFLMPVKSQAAFDLFEDMPSKEEIGNAIAVGIAQFFGAIGDVVMGGFNKFFLGTNGFGSAMITSDSLGKGSWFDPVDDDGKTITPDGTESSTISGFKVGKDSTGSNMVVYVEDSSIDSEAILAGSSTWEVPNLLYCPENIFGNNIAMLDVNFLNPNEYQSVLVSDDRGTQNADVKSESVATTLKSTISGWYKSFRNIAVVALLSILVYLGIRILISSSAEDKAKYKEVIKDWAIALVLVFAMHFIMSATIMVVNLVNNLFVNFNNSVYVFYDGQMFRSNFTGVMRFLSRSVEWENALVYTGVYFMLIIYTISFTIQYLKRVLYIAFYTMIAPLVAITYPLDKLGDGKSQAFNKWLKEYMMTMALQPIHLIIYSMIVSSALTLSIENPIYALVALGFLIPAEQFIKSLFGVESKADAGMGSFAAGAAGMAALGKLSSIIKGGNSGNAKKGEEDEEETTSVRESINSELGSFGNNTPIGPGGGDDDDNAAVPNRPGLYSGNTEDDGSEAGSESGVGLGGYGDDHGVGGYGQYDSRGHLIQPENTYGEDNSELPVQDNTYGLPDNTEDNGLDNNDNSNNKPHLTEWARRRGILGKPVLAAAAAAGAVSNGRRWSKKRIKGAVGALGRANDFLSNGAKHIYNRSLLGAAAGSIKNRWNDPKRALSRSINKKYMGKYMKKVGKPLSKMGKFAARNGLRIAGAATVGALGAVAGLTSGKGLSGAMQGFTTAAVAGAALGDKTYKAPGAITSGVRGAVNSAKGIHDLHTEATIERLAATKGDAAAQKYAREHLTKEQKQRYDRVLDSYLRKNNEVIDKSKSELYKDLYDYESHGVKDESKMIKGLELEHSKKYRDLRNAEPEATHENVVDIMQMTNSFGKEYITDAKKSEQLQSELGKHNLNDRQKDMFNRFFDAANGMDWKQSRIASEDNASRPTSRQARRTEAVDPFAPAPKNENKDKGVVAKPSRRRRNLTELGNNDNNNPTE